jgi:predicted amidophosphoribosyltransferase
MTHLSCRACRIRFAPSASARPICPRCGRPLSSLTSPDAMGYPLWAPASLHWRPADLEALARAVANVGERIQH